MTLQVAALTGGRQVPSARFRVRELIEPLASQEIAVREFVPAVSKYPPTSRAARPLWFAGALAARLPGVLGSHACEVTLLQRELLSTLITLESLTRRPRVLDVDDAIFLRRDGKTARRLAQRVDAIVCGNDYLADWFSQHHDRVSVVPTGIDTRRFVPGKKDANQQETVVVGWTGSRGNLRYLEAIAPALTAAMAAAPVLRLHVVCDAPPHLPGVDPARVTFIPWQAATEVRSVQGFDIGIMPLNDGPWERGKCAFKLLQYLACGVPVVASPVGANQTLLDAASIGHAATTNAEWRDALLALSGDASRRERLGQTGRELMIERYDTRVVAAALGRALRQAL
ncbi:MAG: glycosyltransferase [Pseudomonadota bacterium]